MFPLNANLHTAIVFGNSTTTLFDPTINPTPYNLVLAISMQQEKDLSDTQVFCGTKLLAHNYGKDYPQVLMSVDCGNDTIWINKTGQDEAFVSVVTLGSDPIYSYSTSTETNIFGSGMTPLGPTYNEWLFVMTVIIFFLSYVTWDKFYRPTKKI